MRCLRNFGALKVFNCLNSNLDLTDLCKRKMFVWANYFFKIVLLVGFALTVISFEFRFTKSETLLFLFYDNHSDFLDL